jgi:hypothetical protein
VSPVKYELGFYIPKDGILHRTVLQNVREAYAVVEFFATAH